MSKRTWPRFKADFHVLPGLQGVDGRRDLLRDSLPGQILLVAQIPVGGDQDFELRLRLRQQLAVS
jgi:hypothetical protein